MSRPSDPKGSLDFPPVVALASVNVRNLASNPASRLQIYSPSCLFHLLANVPSSPPLTFGLGPREDIREEREGR